VVGRRRGRRSVDEGESDRKVIGAIADTFYEWIDYRDVVRGRITAGSSDHALEDIIRVYTIISSEHGVWDEGNVGSGLVELLINLIKIMIDPI